MPVFCASPIPAIDADGLERLLGDEFPTLEKKYRGQFVQLFLDLQKKCESAEISSKALDLRGLLDALRLIRRGVGAGMALDMGITNKAFDSYEQGLIRDVITARIPAKLSWVLSSLICSSTKERRVVLCFLIEVV